MRYGEKSFSVAVGGNVSQDEWDRIFKKPSKVDQYVQLAQELVRIRDEHERDWQAREDLHLTAMNQLFASMTSTEQSQCVAASIRSALKED